MGLPVTREKKEVLTSTLRLQDPRRAKAKEATTLR